MSLPIITKPDLALVPQFFHDHHENTCKDLSLQKDMRAVAVSTDEDSMIGPTASYNLYQQRSAPLETYQVVVGESIHNFATMGDVLLFVNKAELKLIIWSNPDYVQVRKPGNTYSIIKTALHSVQIALDQSALSAEAFIKQIFFEVYFAYLRPHDRVLHPHEMPVEHWEAVMMVSNVSYSGIPCLINKAWTINTPWFSNHSFGPYPSYSLMEDLFSHYCGFGHNGPEFGANKEVNSQHKLHVLHALAEGTPVSEIVLASYQQELSTMNQIDKGKIENQVLSALIQFPSLRGVTSVRVLTPFLSILKFEKIEITEQNIDVFINHLNNFKLTNPTYPEMDDYLYALRIIHPYEKNIPAPFDKASATNELSLTIRQHLMKSMIAKGLDHSNRERSKGNISQREFDRQVHNALALDSELVSAKWGNDIVKFIEEKNIQKLLAIFDNSDLDNLETRQAIHEYTGIRMYGVGAQKRRNAIYELCGLSKQQDEINTRIEAAQAKSSKDRTVAKLIERLSKLSSETVQYGKLTMVEFLNLIVNDGHNQLGRQRKGNSFNYYLRNPINGNSWKILKKHGAVDYALEVLKLPIVEIS